MTDRRNLVFAVVVFIAPIVVAWFGLSVPAAAGLVVLLLLGRWLITLSGILKPERTPELELAVMAASHYVEKVRWTMDRLGIDYVEKTSAGTLGVWFRGRSVPQLKVRTGIVRSVIGNSSDILRYLYGRYLHEDPGKLAFLEPTADRVELEKRLDAYGRHLQVWVYCHILDERERCLHAWGVDDPNTPGWQRLVLRVLYPVLKVLMRYAFRISDAHYARVVEHIETLLSELDADLADGRASLLGGDTPNYTDIAFAAFTGLWLMVPGYGGGMADNVRLEHEVAPQSLRDDVDRWRATFPRAVAFVEKLYEGRRNVV